MSSGRWFAEPVYKLSPTTERVIEFKGLNRKTVIDDGEMRDMTNMCSDESPNMIQRKARTRLTYGAVDLNKPTELLYSNGKLAVFDTKDNSFYYDGREIEGAEFRSPSDGECRALINFNDYIFILPEKLLFNARRYNADGTVLFESIDASTTIASATVDSTDNSAYDGTLLTVADGTDLSSFDAGDAIRLTGTLTYGEEGSEQSTVYTDTDYISCVIQSVDSANHKLVLQSDIFLELDAAGVTTGTLTNVTISRNSPTLSHAMQYGNRIWGTVDASNSIVCSKLGDATNWEYYQNESLDSYEATQGTDGKWTGLAAYSNHLLFFKENCIHKVYGSYPAEFQITTQEASGVEEGSEKSVAIIEDYVFYKSRMGIMVYSGSRPELISTSFAGHSYSQAVGGGSRRKYYVSMVNEDGNYEMLVFDASDNVWHREDYIQAYCFVFIDDRLMFSHPNTEDGESKPATIAVIDGDTSTAGYTVDGTADEDMEWAAEFGPFDEYIEDKKVVSRLKMRYELLTDGAYLDVFLKMDHGEFHLIEEYTDDYEVAGQIRIVPTRCDRYTIRLEGKGRCRISSLLREYRQASGRY